MKGQNLVNKDTKTFVGMVTLAVVAFLLLFAFFTAVGTGTLESVVASLLLSGFLLIGEVMCHEW